MGLRPGGEGRAADFFLSFEEEFHVVPEKSVPEEVFESLQVHEQLAFIVVGATGVDGFFAGGGILGDDRLEGARTPFFERLRRLDVVVSIDKDGFLRSGNGLFAEDDRVSCGFMDGGAVGSGGEEEFRQPAGAAVHVGLVFGPGADGRDAQEGKEFFEEAVFVLLDVGFHVVSVFHKNNKNPRNREGCLRFF